VDEYFETDSTVWQIGPYHQALPGPLRLNVKIDGEIIVGCQFERGFLHRGLEKSFERNSWSSAIAYSDRLDPEAAIFGELVLCLAVEELAGISVPPRTSAMRVILSELTRVSSHLVYVVRFAKTVGAETVTHYILRDREKILDLFELLTGTRFSNNYFRFGGMVKDVTEGFIERVSEVCALIRKRLPEYEDLFIRNQALISRTRGVGVLSYKQARNFGVTGPNVRAAGGIFDVRSAHPYFHFDWFERREEKWKTARKGDCYDRLLQRINEIQESLSMITSMAEQIPEGDFFSNSGNQDALNIGQGEAYSRVESPRGLLGCHVVSDGSDRPCRIQFRVPSVATLSSISEVVAGARVEDLPVIFASLDIGIAEADR